MLADNINFFVKNSFLLRAPKQGESPEVVVSKLIPLEPDLIVLKSWGFETPEKVGALLFLGKNLTVKKCRSVGCFILEWN